MKKIILTDTHFGVKQNSITWLNSQKKFICDQFIEHIINMHEPVEIVHLGDVFDSRSSISTLIANEVVNMFRLMCNCENVTKIYIVAGNHDFYSPNSDEVNTVNLLLSNISDKINIIYNDNYIDPPYLYVPWYEWFDQDNIQKLVDDNNIEYVFTHADIISSPVNVVGAKIFSGHTHIPYIKNQIYNLGSCFALNFSDSNSVRGFYILHDDGKLEFRENTKSIKFWRLFNDDIFNHLDNINKNDYLEIYISQSNLGKTEYSDKLTNILADYKNVKLIPQMNEIGGIKLVDFEGYNIENIIYDSIPEMLNSKFKNILEKNKLNH